MSTVTILLLFDSANSANTLWTSKLLDLSQTHLWEDLKASAYFATEVLKQVTVSSHLQLHSSTREATCLYPSDIHIRLAERHKHPQSHTPPSPVPPAVTVLEISAPPWCPAAAEYSPPAACLGTCRRHSNTSAMPCFTTDLHLLPLARTNSGKNSLFPAHKKSCTFKCSSPFAVSSFNNFKTCYSTAFVLYFYSSTLFITWIF